MPNTFKVLARGPATTSASTVYTVPAATTTLVNNILVANTAANAAVYSISLGGISCAASVAAPANDTTVLDIKQVLAATQTISVFANSTAGAGTVNFHISGLEIT